MAQPDVCIGTGIPDNIRFYYTRPKQLNDRMSWAQFYWQARRWYGRREPYKFLYE
jgi:hypothetical protein